jgi:DNA topoisomerase I
MPDEERWWRREGTADRGFRYVGLQGQELTGPATLERIRRLVIPPAWTDVHISPDPGRKIQVWGRDQAGRKQYRYSASHEADRDRRKWRRLLTVARLLPRLRKVTNEHLGRPELDREKVLATVVRLMTRAYFRAGSERYAVVNRTFGICTLSKRHVRVAGNNIEFRYTGKQRKDQRQVVADTPLVEIIEELQSQPGRRLFKYRVGPRRYRPVTAGAVNRYLREVTGERLTSKDLRTFGGTVRAATILADLGPATAPREAKRNVTLACQLVASELGNTPAICRTAYIHPAVLEEYETSGRTVETLSRRRRSKPGVEQHVETLEPVGLYPEELALIRFLERYGGRRRAAA